MPLAADGSLAVLGVDLLTGKRFQPIAAIAPISPPCYFILKPKTASGSVSSQSTVGREITKPTWTMSASEALKAGLTLFGTGVESTTTVGGSRQGTVDKGTQAQSTTTTTPTEVVLSLELHRTTHLPDIAMLEPANGAQSG